MCSCRLLLRESKFVAVIAGGHLVQWEHGTLSLHTTTSVLAQMDAQRQTCTLTHNIVSKDLFLDH